MTESFDLEVGRIRHEAIILDGELISLPVGPVERSQECTLHPDPSSDVGRLWEESRKALSFEVWSRESGILQHEFLLFDRQLDLDRANTEGLGVLEESWDRIEEVAGVEFPSLPPEELMEHGFVSEIRDTPFTFPPTPEVLLSDPFLDSHCFRLLEAPPGSSLLALSFEPSRPRPGVADVAGVLWIESGNTKLQSLSYRYTEFPGPSAPGSAGGWLTFEYLANGMVMTSGWGSRQPEYVSFVNFDERGLARRMLQVAHLSERGGIALKTVGPDSTRLFEESRDRASIPVNDSLWALGFVLQPELDRLTDVIEQLGNHRR